MTLRRTLILVFLSVIAFTSCVSTREQTRQSLYFQAVNDSLLSASVPIEYEPVFQKGDILSVSVVTPNEASSRLFNPVQVGSVATPNEAGASPQGYLVDEAGTITLPLIGQVKAAGMTRARLTDEISKRLKQYVESAIVSIRLLNYRITVLGEVAKPGTFSIPSERVTVLDAIGLAGDLTVYGKRNNIRVIRTADGVRKTATLDLNKGNIFDSPFYYLRQNDVVYIQMNDRKIPNTDQASLRNVSIGLGIISAIGVIISTINVLR